MINCVKAFNTLTNLQIRCPLMLLRHFILYKPLQKDNHPYILPQFNIIRSLVEKNTDNPIRSQTFVLEHYINAALRKKNISLEIHNKLIWSIFLHFLCTRQSEKEYL